MKRALILISAIAAFAVPFTTATFGEAALPWIYTNMGLALAVMVGVAVRAYRATRAVSLR